MKPRNHADPGRLGITGSGRPVLKTIAALYVLKDGPYYGLDGIEPWALPDRDAREYGGPHPVIAHPPCARWGRYWSGGPMLARTPRALKKGDDGGCFAAAIASVRKFGGILEHPEASHAWPKFGLFKPHRWGGWIMAGDGIGWTCCVEQGHYGHPAQKPTWLYAVRVELPSLRWGHSGSRTRLDAGYHSTEERHRRSKLGIIGTLSKRQRQETPLGFRDLLIEIARSSQSTGSAGG